jgi:hypothetical protein
VTVELRYRRDCGIVDGSIVDGRMAFTTFAFTFTFAFAFALAFLEVGIGVAVKGGYRRYVIWVVGDVYERPKGALEIGLDSSSSMLMGCYWCDRTRWGYHSCPLRGRGSIDLHARLKGGTGRAFRCTGREVGVASWR